MAHGELVVLTGPDAGKRVAVEDKVTLGRAPGNTLVLAQRSVSNRHAELEVTPDGVVLRDLNSTNGTYVDKQRVTEYALLHGDVIRIRPFSLQFQADTTGPPSGGSDPGLIRYSEDADRTVDASDPRALTDLFIEPTEALDDVNVLRRLRNRFAAVYKANQLIAGQHDLEHLFEVVIDQVFELTHPHGCALLLDNGQGKLVPKFAKVAPNIAQVTLSRTIAYRAFRKAEAILTRDAGQDSRFDDAGSVIAHNISSAMCVPLLYQGQALGVLYADTRGVAGAFEEEDLQLLSALAGATAVALKKAEFVQMLEQSYHDTLVVLANAVEQRDHYTVGHTWRVTHFACEMARELGWSAAKIAQCEMGALLHDLGKITIPGRILRKPGRLTEEERARVRAHPQYGALMLEKIAFLKPVIPYVLYHHERFDGKTEGVAQGYPFGLARDEIPLEGRVINVADAFDALTSARSYKQAMAPGEALAVLESDKDGRCDPRCVEALAARYKQGRIHAVLQCNLEHDPRSIACPFCSTFILPPEGAVAGREFHCSICRRKVRLIRDDEGRKGVLIDRPFPHETDTLAHDEPSTPQQSSE